MLIASGLGHYAPFLAGWQEFKDNLRKIVEYQPGGQMLHLVRGMERCKDGADLTAKPMQVQHTVCTIDACRVC
jgi:hypothetical protein